MKQALVTGASSGIGAAIVGQLLAEGWQVLGLSRSAPPFAHEGFRHLAVDLSDRQELVDALSSVPTPQAIIHAAGMMAAAPLGELDTLRGETLWRLHVDAAQTLANRFAPVMSRGGRIILLGSRTSRGAAGRSQYTATKAALARSWAAELAAAGITVNVVAPGATDTPMLRQPGRESSPPKTPPLGRLIKPQEVVSLVSWLLSEEAAAMTGQELVMCGGASLS
ncbi:TPA: SDR family oxidoreductase [Klebsiella aerogenes]|uniref:Short-chain dehydrogenase/reductase SDR n=1 Tax=Klebsiella aerogenes (strain ATCC 13048 / DSM 30053 / CCUG 1429 / JCM 1235 / KCTC 2190 / NBRC 13534 / NCIMB 10102 / NCTC 10006 / CDC 819-56) TaxID=1028307 RepID=A0A0H3FVL9_KLEAK|nr:SDR family oxidoreductase [Klebsiella aerogenes]AEG98621.1 short-chain dehydrogenase/reductase SDR [Klebsiella aerogenes KCTC 2190]KLF33571.1 oxidoreductase [Klebsiella aerogenes]MEC4757039.1 SDR family oxidoreductase [Klebsiella aerogenes]QEU18560.1 SDR family oxidoreductase [Klebsiella aerogenes]QXB12225.1 SDR family oxidoreductase [Klebsiella aerogenes]